jgi:CelD/BcsL family acetyltransferase involved in cellulose biosynthesis
MAGLVIKSAIERGIREFDFLHGDEGYKYLWASAERELLRFHFFPPQAHGAFLSRLMHTRRSVVQLLKRKPAGHGERPPLTDRSAPAAGATSHEASEDAT